MYCKKRMIITNQVDELSDLDALELVNKVIQEGRISNNHTQYCLCSKFGEIVVVADRTANGADTFRIYRERIPKKWVR